MMAVEDAIQKYLMTHNKFFGILYLLLGILSVIYAISYFELNVTGLLFMLFALYGITYILAASLFISFSILSFFLIKNITRKQTIAFLELLGTIFLFEGVIEIFDAIANFRLNFVLEGIIWVIVATVTITLRVVILWDKIKDDGGK